VRQTTKISD